MKWTAPEVFKTGRHEANSDVWSFGIVMHEIFNLCELEPYPNISNEEFKKYYTNKVFTGEKEIPSLETPSLGSNEM